MQLSEHLSGEDLYGDRHVPHVLAAARGGDHDGLQRLRGRGARRICPAAGAGAAAGCDLSGVAPAGRPGDHFAVNASFSEISSSCTASSTCAVSIMSGGMKRTVLMPQESSNMPL